LYCYDSYHLDIKFVETLNGRHSVPMWGSSGSPLINSNRKVIGQVYGSGDCDIYECDNPGNQWVGFGKFSVSWNVTSHQDV
jgi:hypothetical protein